MLRTTSVTGHGKAIRLIEFSSSFRAETKDFHINSCPPFMTIKQAPSDEAGRLSQELFELLHHISKETNIHHFWLEVLCLSSGQDQSIHEPVSRGEILKAAISHVVWLGSSANDSETALRCVGRLSRQIVALPVKKMWSQQQGRAILALSERPMWKSLDFAELSVMSNDIRVYCGMTNVSWSAILAFRDTLDAIVREGRVEHHAFARQMLGSFAGVAFSNLEDPESSDDERPLQVVAQQSNAWSSIQNLSSHLDVSITMIENRWNMIHLQDQAPVPDSPEMQSETDLDAEIAKYTNILLQIDAFEADLEHLNSVTSSLRFMQSQARSPRHSPEVSP